MTAVVALFERLFDDGRQPNGFVQRTLYYYFDNERLIWMCLAVLYGVREPLDASTHVLDWRRELLNGLAKWVLCVLFRSDRPFHSGRLRAKRHMWLLVDSDGNTRKMVLDPRLQFTQAGSSSPQCLALAFFRNALAFCALSGSPFASSFSCRFRIRNALCRHRDAACVYLDKERKSI